MVAKIAYGEKHENYVFLLSALKSRLALSFYSWAAGNGELSLAVRGRYTSVFQMIYRTQAAERMKDDVREQRYYLLEYIHGNDIRSKKQNKTS